MQLLISFHFYYYSIYLFFPFSFLNKFVKSNNFVKLSKLVAEFLIPSSVVKVTYKIFVSLKPFLTTFTLKVLKAIYSKNLDCLYNHYGHKLHH